MKKAFYPLIAGLLFFIFPQEIFATHIVGGEMNYRCLGNDLYEIELTIFRDCDTGEPDFDYPASVGIFSFDSGTNTYNLQTSITDTLILTDEVLANLNTTLGQIGNSIILPNVFGPDTLVSFGHLVIPFINNDTLNPQLSNPCLVVPPNVCVNTTTYRDTVRLPFITGGYTLNYQRCCRNASILNIVDPLGTGATYPIDISETSLLECNSNAVFNEWPPIYICVNEPIDFDHSATDIDGDSLVYKLCVPYSGATPDAPRPQPPLGPIFNEVIWIDPPYDLTNIMGGVPLTIDSETGFMTGIPNTIGQFVVGVCVEEYRDGVLISTTRRDFQYNIGVCGDYLASFFVPEVSCEGLEVSFDNQSINPQEFYWEFNDPGNPGSSSTLENPIFMYSDTGTYTAMLAVSALVDSTLCADTTYNTFAVYEASITSEFALNFAECQDSFEIEITNLSEDTVFALTNYEWIVNDSPFSGSENPPNFIGDTSNFPITFSLTITNEVGCEKTFEDTITGYHTSAFFVPEILCEGLIVNFENLSENASSYVWHFNDPNNPGETSTETNPSYTYSEDGTYSVMLISAPDANQSCIDTIINTFSVYHPSVVAGFDYDVLGCDEIIEIEFDDISTDSIYSLSNWEWSINDNPFSSSSDPANYLGDPNVFPISVSLIVTNENGCMDTIMQNIDSGIDLSYGDTAIFCERLNSILLSVDVLNMPDTFSFEWAPSGGILSGGDTNMPLVDLTVDSVFQFTVTYNDGCIFTDSIVVTNGSDNLLINATADPDTIFEGSSSQLEVTGDNLVTYDWTPPFTLDDPTIFDPTATPESTTEYVVTVTDTNGCIDSVSVLVVVLDIICEEPYLFMPNAFTPNNDGNNDVLYVEGNLIDEMHLAIYNRWGEKVFESKDKTLGWNGYYKDELLEPDVYGYYLTIKCLNGEEYFKKGNINLIR